ncbi:hypothetical protein [Deinococcus hopiensis]|uniref:hypothetical protein n=1 Tax=Deinococcus hopiensis TaxID=309885 RepID=UPI000A052E28|nr:hypothetical protein [Deinococcus hopiensis]
MDSPFPSHQRARLLALAEGRGLRQWPTGWCGREEQSRARGSVAGGPAARGGAGLAGTGGGPSPAPELAEGPAPEGRRNGG